MPDMQTALTTALSKMNTKEMPNLNTLLDQWAESEATTMTKPSDRNHRITNNVSRVVFNCIRDNPGISRRELVKRLLAQQFKESSVTSLITQYLRGGLIREDGNKLYAIDNEYRSVYTANAKAKRKAIKAKAKVKPAAQSPTPAPTPEAFNPAALIESLTVYQAKLVYNELKTMFTGA